MIDEATKKAIAVRESVFRNTGTAARLCQESRALSNALKISEENSATMKRIAEEFTRHDHRYEQMMRAALGPAEELRRTGSLDAASRLAAQFKPVQAVLAEIEKRFRLPELGEAARVFREMNNTGIASILKRYHEEESGIQRALEAMQSPWLDRQNIARSFEGLSGLQSIGHALSSLPSFDEKLTETLRIDLGDWRPNISWPEDIFIDPLARTDFYTARGFNAALTTFPSDAFEEGIELAKLASPLLSSHAFYDPDSDDQDGDTEEIDLTRTNVAHDRLQRFETKLRQFINRIMTEAFGNDWIKHRTPGNLRRAWLDKKQKALDSGEREHPLLAYADFTDYLDIIIRKDNWNEVFKPYFRRRESIQESFQRLYPIRICTMHARLITQDDELYLHVEIKRILKAIGDL